MNNVYAQIQHFYNTDIDAEQILRQEEAERYIRRCAWHGAKDPELKKTWMVLQITITYIEQAHLYSFFSLSIYDYQEILYRTIYAKTGFSADEQSVQLFFSILDNFFENYLQNHQPSPEEEILFDHIIEHAQAAFYEDGVFVMPPRRTKDEFYSSLMRMDEIDNDALDKLNNIMDNLLQKINDFFHTEKFENDLNRATYLFCGPNGETGPEMHEVPEEAAESVWMGFWDYFLLDYHLISSDEIPLHYFFKQEKDNLSISEQDMLRDLLEAKFIIFTIEEDQGDFCVCRNLMTDESLMLPHPDFPLLDFTQQIFYGHVHLQGITVMNHVTSVPASAKLRQRMKEILQHQFELFRCQKPGAGLEDFIQRESGAIRHTLNIMSSFAQLNVIPSKKMPKALPAHPDIRKNFQHEEAMLDQIAHHMGFSCFAAKLLQKLFEDYMSVADADAQQKEIAAILTADLFCFGHVNGIDFDQIPGMINMLGAEQDDVHHHMECLRSRLHCKRFDPRYLTEEGFVTSLYAN